MEMEAAHPHNSFFLSPSPHHLAELRNDPPHSAVAFSAPGAAGRKRRCLLPAASYRKKMLLELHPFGSPPSPSPSPPPSPCRSPATAPPLLSRVGPPASQFSFPSAVAWTGGSGGGGGRGGGGNIFAFVENTPTPTTPSPTGSNASVVSFLASPGRPTTRTGSSPSGVFAFATSPKQPATPTGPTASGGFVFTASPEQPLTPTGSTAGGGLASLSTEPSLLPREYHGGRAVAPWPSPKHARTGSTDSEVFAFFPSPGPAIVGHTGSPTSPAFVFSASRTLASPVHKSGGGSNKRSRRLLSVATARRRSLRQWEEVQQVTAPPQKVAKTGALATGEASRSFIQSGSSARPCCTFFTSSKASKQETKKGSSEASRGSSSPGRSRCTSATSPARPSSVEKENEQEQEVEASSVAREDPAPILPAACLGDEVVVRVTCPCGAHKEFSFDHCH